jgi:hypothetical protein
MNFTSEYNQTDHFYHKKICANNKSFPLSFSFHISFLLFDCTEEKKKEKLNV